MKDSSPIEKAHLSYGNRIRFVIALNALMLGVLVYIFGRASDSTFLGKIICRYFGDVFIQYNFFGDLGGLIPELVHPFSFALFTIILFPAAGRIARGLICLGWMIINIVFEIGQYFSNQFSEFILIIFNRNMFSELLTNYFIAGTYDHGDILAIVFGIIAAFAISEFTINEGEQNDPKISTTKGFKIKKSGR